MMYYYYLLTIPAVDFTNINEINDVSTELNE